ncbi:MAG: hypothetical protein SFX73_04770 [Kofleriaceae bacterium]|nr:hypothetical protein [Kofleriaceae bacterium]
MDGCIFGGANPVALRSGGALSCGALAGEAEWVELLRPGTPTQRVVLPYPNAGLGGQELVVSPDERYAAMYVYSGQSEQGYELFELAPALRHLRSVRYLEGEGDAPRFSPDGRWLVMVTTVVPTIRGTEEYVEEILTGGQGDAPVRLAEVLVDWAEVSVLEVPDGELSQVAIGTLLSRGFDYDAFSEWTLHEAWQFSAADRVTMVLPWGAGLELQIPPIGPVTTEPFPVSED